MLPLYEIEKRVLELQEAGGGTVPPALLDKIHKNTTDVASMKSIVDNLSSRIIMKSDSTAIKASPTSDSFFKVKDKSDGVTIEMGSPTDSNKQNVILQGMAEADPNSNVQFDSFDIKMFGARTPTVQGIGLIKSNEGQVVVDGIYTIGVKDSDFAGKTVPEAFAIVGTKWTEYLTARNYQHYGTRILHTSWTYGQLPNIEAALSPSGAVFATGDVLRLEVQGDATTVYAKLDNLTQDHYYFITFRRADIGNYSNDWWKEIQAHNIGKTLPQQPDADGKYVLQKASGISSWVAESAGSSSVDITTITSLSQLGLSDGDFSGLGMEAAIKLINTKAKALAPSGLRFISFYWQIGQLPNAEAAMLPDDLPAGSIRQAFLNVLGNGDFIQADLSVMEPSGTSATRWTLEAYLQNRSQPNKNNWVRQDESGLTQAEADKLYVGLHGTQTIYGDFYVGDGDGRYVHLTNGANGIPVIEAGHSGALANELIIRGYGAEKLNKADFEMESGSFLTVNGQQVLTKDVADSTYAPTGAGGGGLTQADADKRYVGLSGDQNINGVKTINDGLDIKAAAPFRVEVADVQGGTHDYKDVMRSKFVNGKAVMELGSGSLDTKLFTKDTLTVEKADGTTVDLLAGGSSGLTQAEADKLYLSLNNGGTVGYDVIVEGELAAQSVGMQYGSNGGLNISGDSAHTNLIPVGGDGSEKPLYTLNFNHSDNKWYIGNKAIQIGTTVRSAGSDLPDAPSGDGQYELRVASGVRSWVKPTTPRSSGSDSDVGHDLPDAPTEDGNYDLKRVSGALSWVKDEVSDLPSVNGKYVMKVDGAQHSWEPVGHPSAPTEDGDYALRVTAHKTTWERIPAGAGAGTGSHDVHVVGITEGDADARYVKKSEAFKQNKADALYFKKTGGVISGETSVRDMFTANEITAQTHGRTGIAIGGNYEESGFVPLDMGGHHVPNGLLHYDHARGIWMVAGKPIQLDTGKDIVPSFLAYLNKDEEVHVKANEVNNTSKGKMWFGNIVTGISPAMTADATTKTYTVKELRGINQDSGTDYLVSLRVGMIGVAPSDGFVRVYLFDEIDGFVADKEGNPLVIEKHFRNGEKLGKLELTGVMNVKGTKTFSCNIVDSFTGNIRITENTETPSGLMVQGLTSEVKTGEGFLQYQLDSGETINLRSHYLGEDNFLVDFANEPEQVPTEISGTTGTHLTSGLYLNNLAPVMMGVQHGSLNINDAGELYDYNLVGFFDSQETYALRGEEVSIKATLRERKSALKLALLKWTGDPDAYNRGVYNVREHGNPVLASGWSFVGSLDIPPSSDGTTTVHKDFTIPNDANNFAIMLYPAQESMVNQLALDSIGMDVKDHFVAYSLKPNTISGQEYLKYSKLHKTFHLTSGNLSFIRYTVGMNRVPVKIGQEVSGKADVVAATLNGSADKGVLEFTRTGTATINASVLIRNETASKNEVHLWWEILKDGALTNVDDGAIDSYIEAHNNTGVYYALPEIKVPVVAGTKLVLCAQSNMSDGLYIQANYNGKPAVETSVEFTELP